MAYSIPSVNFLAVCLVLAKGDTGISTGEVIKRAEAFQKANGSHFGVSDADFFHAFIWLGIETHILQSESLRYYGEIPELNNIPLGRWIPFMLESKFIHFNDGGEEWCDKTALPSERNHLLREFFKYSTNSSPESVLHFLKSLGMGDDAFVKRNLEAGVIMFGEDPSHSSDSLIK